MDGKQEGGKQEGGTVSKREGWLARGGNGKQGKARGRDSKQGGGDMRSCSIRLKLSSSCICKQLYSTRQPSCCGGQQSHTGGMAKMKMNAYVSSCTGVHTGTGSAAWCKENNMLM